MKFGDLAHSRDAAGRHIDGALLSTDCAAIYTPPARPFRISPTTRSAPQSARRIARAPISGQGASKCPNMTFTMADQIQNKQDKSSGSRLWMYFPA